MPLPQTSVTQFESHPSPSALFPSSQFSPRPGCTRPSPQNSFTQAELHPSPSALFPSSHCSAASRMPLPQTDSHLPRMSALNIASISEALRALLNISSSSTSPLKCLDATCVLPICTGLLLPAGVPE